MLSEVTASRIIIFCQNFFIRKYSKIDVMHSGTYKLAKCRKSLPDRDFWAGNKWFNTWIEQKSVIEFKYIKTAFRTVIFPLPDLKLLAYNGDLYIELSDRSGSSGSVGFMGSEAPNVFIKHFSYSALCKSLCRSHFRFYTSTLIILNLDVWQSCSNRKQLGSGAHVRHALFPGVSVLKIHLNFAGIFMQMPWQRQLLRSVVALVLQTFLDENWRKKVLLITFYILHESWLVKWFK